MADVITGPSGGAPGDNSGLVSRDLLEKHPDLARQLVAIGRHPRAGHDRKRWQSVNWDDYRARVRPGRSSGPWHTEVVSSAADDPGAILSNWVAEAEGLPVAPPGWNTALYHADRGLVMSDVPAEIAGALPFLDATEKLARARVLIAGLGLGIIPARLLKHGHVARIDVVEIDPDVVALTTGGCYDNWAPNAWAADPRLHVWLGDACTWWPPSLELGGCMLHDGPCDRPQGATFDTAWFDIWDLVSPANLPSMHRLHRRFARRVNGRMWSWERAECEAMRRRGQTMRRPYCYIDEDGYPASLQPPGDR